MILMAFVRASIACQVGNSENTLFWLDPWLDGRSFEEQALDLVAAMGTRCRNR
jgi:hypothetical protein